MGKHKQSKRERKFEAKGGVKARLEKGGTVVSKGKKKKMMKRKGSDHDTTIVQQQQKQKQQQQRAQKNSDEYQQQIQAQRDAHDFVGRENLADLDVNRFFATLEDELKNHPDDVSTTSSSSNNSGDDEGDSSAEEEQDNKARQKHAKNRNKPEKKNDEADFEDDDDDVPSSSSEEEEKSASNKRKKANLVASKSQQNATSKKKKEDENNSDVVSSSDDDNDSDEGGNDKSRKDGKKPNKMKKGPSTGSDSSESDSDDEDIEAVEAKMKAEMKRLQSQDPEFHEFLQQNERSLLEFGDAHGEDNDDDDDDDVDDDDDSDEDQLTKQKNKKGVSSEEKQEAGIELTPKILKQLSYGAFHEHGIKSLKKLLKAYKAACKVATNADDNGDDDPTEGPKKKRKRQNIQEKTYRIESSQVFDRLMMTCLGRCHEAFSFHLLETNQEEKQSSTAETKIMDKVNDSDDGDNEEEDDDGDRDIKMDTKKDDKLDSTKVESMEDPDEKPLDPKVLERSPRWAEVKPLLNVFLRSTLHLISESKEPNLLAIVLKSLAKYVRYMTPFPRIADALLKTLTSLWSAPLGDASADYQVVRLNAFLRIRQLALTQPFPFIELCLKKTYLAYARRAKFGGDSASIMTNALPTLTFMGNCLVELYSLDHTSSYLHAFVYIRQLALLLRGYMQKKTKEAAQQVFCWQFVHCLKLWVAVLSTCCKQAREGMNEGKNPDQLMRELVYPLTEIILGTVRLMPNPARLVPLRFQCIRLCQQLAASSEKFIPATSLLMPVLDLKELDMKPKKIKSKGSGSTTRGVQLPFLLKLSKDDPLRTAEEQEAVVAEFFQLLNRELELYRYSPGFPEFQFNINQKLKKVRRLVDYATTHA